MAQAPRLNFFDGSGSSSELTITTNLTGLVLTGTVDPGTVDVQINLNGAGWTSDPALVALSLPRFSVPNPSSIPDGLRLERGQNTVLLRSLDSGGSVSPAAAVVVTVVSDMDLLSLESPPTGISCERHAQSVSIRWSVPTGDAPSGYNVYASTGAGGSGSGYLRVNKDLIPSSSPVETIQEEFPTYSVSYDLQDPQPPVLEGGETFAGSDLVIASRTVDPATGVTVDEKTLNVFPLVRVPKFRLRTSVAALVETRLFSFVHNRDDGEGNGIVNSDSFSIVSDEDPLFYVVTAVYYDRASGQLQESRYSKEVAAAPLAMDTTVRGIRIRRQKDVAESYILEVGKTRPELSLIPSSTIREVHIEPFSNEIQKSNFLMDFVHRSKSFAALLQIDDPGLTGTSVSVSNSSYKQQLRASISATSDSAVQSLIDGAFDSLAQNFSTPRLGRRPATVFQTFWTSVRPTRNLTVAQGAIVSSSKVSTAPRFKANGATTMVAERAQSYYNQDKRRYEIRVQMVAETPGATGNLSAGDLDTVVSGANGLQTVNDVASDFGRDRQSNLELAEQAMRAISGIDVGTEGGYGRTASSTPGLFDVRVVKSGDPYMMRDYDPVRKKHIGGKVDIYVKGTIERTVNETFAFQFDLARSVRFDVVDPVNLVLRARDSRLTPSNPIQEIMNNPSQGLGFRNHSTSPTQSYDLTGAYVLDYRTVRLSQAIPQPATFLDDFVEGDYRFRSNNRFTASVQPVRRITSVTGEGSGSLDPAGGFTLYKLQDPLLEGESTISTDYVEIHQLDGVPNGIPSQVNDEAHILVGQFEEPLGAVGINEFTVAVFSSDRSIQYLGPSSSSPDYLIVSGSQTEPVRVVRSTTTTIPSGSSVSVDYQKDENFRVEYVVNDVLQTLQSRISEGTSGGRDGSHVTADVLVKQSLENPLSTEMTVQLKQKADIPTTDSAIRTNVTVLTDGSGIGGAAYQSGMVSVTEKVDGVSYIVQPFSRLTLQDGAVRIRDKVLSDHVRVPSLDQFNNAAYLLIQALPFSTTDGGGGDTIHHGVYMDELIMEPAASLELLASGPNRAWIVGRLGASIPGYSDDATLLPVFQTAEAVAAERVRRTANKVVVSLPVTPEGNLPSDHSFSATYVVQGDTGSKDVTVSPIEYLTPGSLTITYKEAPVRAG
jgi:hypothetical protein